MSHAPLPDPDLPATERRLVSELVELLAGAAGTHVVNWEAQRLPRGSTHARVRLHAHFALPVARAALRDAYRDWPARRQGVMLEADSFEGDSEDLEADLIYRLN